MKVSKQRERGFTLIEMMVVVIIMGLLAAIAVPNMDLLFSRNKLRGSTTSVTSSLYLTRMKAINEGLPYGVEFSGDGSFQIYRDPYNANEAFGTPYNLDAGLTFSEVSFIDELAVFTEYGQLHKDCLPSGEMVGSVKITDGISDTTKVEVTFLSGRIRETNR